MTDTDYRSLIIQYLGDIYSEYLQVPSANNVGIPHGPTKDMPATE